MRASMLLPIVGDSMFIGLVMIHEARGFRGLAGPTKKDLSSP